MPQKRVSNVEENNADVQQVVEALAKIHDPMAKYFFAMFIDLMAERIGALVDANKNKPAMPSELKDLARAFGQRTPERLHG